MAKIISICSEKGGVGKTTTTFNVAGALAKKGKKVLCIDLDQQQNLSTTLGYVKDGKPTIADLIYNTVAGNEIDIEYTIRQSNSNIDYVPSSPMLTNITSIISNDPDSNYVLKRALDNDIYNSYDYILIDCRTLLDLLIANAMNASDYVVIPVESGVYAYTGLDKMLDKVKSINASTNRKLQVLGILFNKSNNTKMGKAVQEATQAEYENLTFKTSIPYRLSQTEQAANSQICCVDDNKNTLKDFYISLADEIIERIEK